jgi:hypothetical protein
MKPGDITVALLNPIMFNHDDFIDKTSRAGPKVGPWQEEGEMGYGWAEAAVEKRRDRRAVLEKMVKGSGYEGEERGKYERRKTWNGYREYLPPWLRG